jgi:hypothetical protein
MCHDQTLIVLMHRKLLGGVPVGKVLLTRFQYVTFSKRTGIFRKT